MKPQYIMRYGFYEGNTPWRTDPIAIAFVFGLRTLEQIESAFPGRLHQALTEHFLAARPRGAATGGGAPTRDQAAEPKRCSVFTTIE